MLCTTDKIAYILPVAIATFVSVSKDYFWIRAEIRILSAIYNYKRLIKLKKNW